jgi:hypothetical protein
LVFVCLSIPLYLQACCGGGCGLEKTPVSQDNQSFVGSWEGEDGTTLKIRADGSADVSVKKGVSKEITGGSAVFEGETLKGELFGMKQVFTIDEAPSEGGDSMTLSGEVFSRR